MNKKGDSQFAEQLAKAAQFHQQGELVKAKSLYTKLLKKDKQNAQAHHLLGLVYLQQSHFPKAVNSIKRAILIQPTDSSFVLSLANAYVSLNDIEQLETLVQHCEKFNLENISIKLKLANLLVKNAKYQAAVAIFETIIEQDKTNWKIWLEFGNCLFFIKELERAKYCYQESLRLSPGQVDALNNLAAISIEIKDLAAAMVYVEQVFSSNSNHLVARFNYANILYQQKEWGKAKDVLAELTDQSPEYLDAYFLAAKVERALGDYSTAFIIYESLLDKSITSEKLFSEIGNSYFETSNFEQAKSFYLKALDIGKETVDARFNLAVCNLQLRDYNNAVKEFSDLLKIAPEYFSAYAPYLHALRQSCLWHEAKTIEASLRLNLETKTDIDIPPFSMITLESSHSQEQIRVAHHWINRQSTAEFDLARGQNNTPIESHQNRIKKRRRIRLGYLSADFHDHATAILLVRILELHDTNEFECFAYSYGPDDQSKLRRRVERSVEHFNNLFNTPKQKIVEIIRQDQLDILVDLKGFTQNSLSQILLARLAPVQINYLGYPASMGKALVDYVIVDEFIMRSEKVEFEETPLLMPNSYQPTDNTRVVGDKPLRENLGLRDEQFVFAAFHQGYKLNQKTIDAWAKILNECPNSILWCLSLSYSAQSVIQQCLENCGVDKTRVVFAEKVSPQQHIARLQCADLILDSFPVNGHTTTSDSLWAGVPVVTIAGDTFISRVAGSLLNAANLSEFICDDFSGYQAKAIEMYNNPSKLKEISEMLTKSTNQLPLFDSESYTKNLESLYISTLQS